MKTVTIAGCLLILAAMSQSAMGHDDNGSRTASSPGGADVDGGVAGTFYGSAGHYVGFNGGTVDLPYPVGPVDPDFFVTRGIMVCDLEVLGDGTSNQEPDERKVDGQNTGVGTVPDGTFDDGGNGGACHTNHYDLGAYNTPGCVDDGARANNLDGVIAAPWVGASCDWKTTEGGISPEILIACLVNGIRDGIDDQPAEAIQCILDFVSCVLCTPTWSCGSDGIADGINYGPGNTRVPYPYSGGSEGGGGGGDDSFADDGLNCTSSDATMSAYVFTGITVSEGGTIVTTTNPAIQGDIWQVA